jgi:hypothetical protein
MVRCYRCRLVKSKTEFFPSEIKSRKGKCCRDCKRQYAKELWDRKRQTRTSPRLSSRQTPYWKPACERPTLRDLAWVAGFLEGEGSFGKQYGQVYATQKDPECLYRLQRYFGGSICRRIRPISHGGLSDVHDWRCYGPAAMGVMLTVYSFMSTRRKAQIRTAIEAIQARRAAALANRKTWRWHCDPSGQRRYVDVTDRADVSGASEAGGGQAGLFDCDGHP